MRTNQQWSSALGRLLNTDKRSPKPRHPDVAHWVWAFASFAIVAVALWGEEWLVALARQHTGVAAYLTAHRQVLAGINWWLSFAAVLVLMLTVGSLLWTLITWIWWQGWVVPCLRGQYWRVVMPKPQRGSMATTNTNPDSPHVFWDRLLAIVSTAAPHTPTSYLATEMWGDPGGRVHWGVWMPEGSGQQPGVIHRLIAAERPQARLVAAPDPLMAATTTTDDPDDDGTRWYASALLLLAAHDYYPLPNDGLALASLVAALRPSPPVCASGVSVIVSPAPPAWARRVDQLVRRWRWMSRHGRRLDVRYQEETDAISLKAQQPHARTCIRVHVVARTKDAAQRECRSLVATLTMSRKRYRACTQSWIVHAQRVMRVQEMRLPAAGRVRAPFRALPRPFPCFPLA